MSYSFLKKYILVFFFILSIIFTLVLFGKYLIPLVLPFMIAYFTTLLLRPLIHRFDALGISRTLTALLFTAFAYICPSGVIYLILRSLWRQVRSFALNIIDSPEKVLTPFNNFISKLLSDHPDLVKRIDLELIGEKISERLAGYATAVLEKTASFAFSMPDILLFIFAMIFSTYYFIKSYGKGGNNFVKLLPKALLAVLYYCKNLFVRYIKRYLLSMGVMLFIVFIILCIGFLILDIEYFILLAFVISFIDMLPILGVGTVLAPWGIISLCTGNTFKGVGLILLYLIILFLRQLIEPRLIGRNVGLSPLITLISAYMGYVAFGIAGVILAPFFAVIVTSVIKDMSENDEDKTNGFGASKV